MTAVSLLQAGATQQYVDYLVLLGVTSVAMVLGLFIVFQAYRGYRRNASRRMLYLALGLALLTVAPFALSIAVASLGRTLGLGPRTYTFFLPVTTRLVEIAGLGCILYSLNTRT
ncbi:MULTISPECIES: DUF7521 family protein [Halorussus]|uniref:DUF7521 family protein n=1 Tax=Halorussus TaxID=1070314 RepID=UPI0020A03CC3|nr:hypothetical protein [Halorussus vallis]USZ74962.1 hypothetical protein NGM07_16170 [Halorussus vallis]